MIQLKRSGTALNRKAAMVSVLIAVCTIGCADNGAHMPDGGAPMTCGMLEADTTDDDGACVIPACDDLDPDQMGMLGGTESYGGGPLTEALNTNGCRADDGVCMPVSYGKHKGGNARHNACADTEPRPNLFWNQNQPAGSGADAVVRGICFDGTAVPNMSMPSVHQLREAKVARFRMSRTSGKRPCKFVQKKILFNVIASIYKERPIANACGHDYIVAFADRGLYDAWTTLMANENNNRAGKPLPINIGQNNNEAVRRTDLYRALGLNISENDPMDVMFTSTDFNVFPSCDN